MATLAAFISSAIEKVSHDEVYANMEFATAEEARTNFTSALLFELGLGPKPAAAHAPVKETKKEEKAPKKRAAKKSKEAVVAEAAVAVLEQVKEAPKEVEALAEQMGQLALDEQPKPKKARKTKGNGSGEPVSDSEPESVKSAEPVKEKKKPGPKPKAKGPEPAPAPVGDAIAWDVKGTPVAYAAVPAPVAEKKKPGPKPKAKPEGTGNLEKLTPTHKKHIKAIAAELKVEAKEKEFLAYANEMTAEAWGAKPLDDHIREFLMPETPELAPPPTEFLEVEFNGKDYLIDPASRFVYAANDDGKVKARDQVGIVGMGAFEDMEIPEEDE
jgi:glucan-binding YG repeat protein